MEGGGGGERRNLKWGGGRSGLYSSGILRENAPLNAPLSVHVIIMMEHSREHIHSVLIY